MLAVGGEDFVGYALRTFESFLVGKARTCGEVTVGGAGEWLQRVGYGWLAIFSYLYASWQGASGTDTSSRIQTAPLTRRGRIADIISS